mmetsp:Transcript_18685/g.27728  ORF Transcript_18685/g.27728 Transcript_18685/m.27728 type:complete len:86 (-) Transcript_18685:307-564(-)
MLLGSKPFDFAVEKAMLASIALTIYDMPAMYISPINPDLSTSIETDPAANVDPIDPSPAIGANSLEPSSAVNTELMNAQCCAYSS